ncbi:MAG: hypothetical protein ABIW31_03985 [Novosphingobium sp.]
MDRKRLPILGKILLQEALQRAPKLPLFFGPFKIHGIPAPPVSFCALGIIFMAAVPIPRPFVQYRAHGLTGWRLYRGSSMAKLAVFAWRIDAVKWALSKDGGEKRA